MFSLLAQKHFLHISDTANVRVAELLTAVNLENRYAQNNTANIDMDIDWSNVDCAINAFRTASLAYLEKIVRNQEKLS